MEANDLFRTARAYLEALDARESNKRNTTVDAVLKPEPVEETLRNLRDAVAAAERLLVILKA